MGGVGLVVFVELCGLDTKCEEGEANEMDDKWSELKMWLERGVDYMDELKPMYEKEQESLSRIDVKQKTFKNTLQKMNELEKNNTHSDHNPHQGGGVIDASEQADED